MEIINSDCQNLRNLSGSYVETIGLDDKTRISVYNSGFMNVYICNNTVINNNNIDNNKSIRNYKISFLLVSSLLFSLLIQ